MSCTATSHQMAIKIFCVYCRWALPASTSTVTSWRTRPPFYTVHAVGRPVLCVRGSAVKQEQSGALVPNTVGPSRLSSVPRLNSQQGFMSTSGFIWKLVLQVSASWLPWETCWAPNRCSGPEREHVQWERRKCCTDVSTGNWNESDKGLTLSPWSTFCFLSQDQMTSLCYTWQKKQPAQEIK